MNGIRRQPLAFIFSKGAGAAILAILLVLAIAAGAAMGQRQCLASTEEPVCAAWTIGPWAVLAIGFTVWGVLRFRRYHRNMRSATVDHNSDSLWILFDRRDSEAEVVVTVEKDGTFDISARQPNWNSGGPSQMTILYYGDGLGFKGSPHQIPVPQLYRAIPMTTAKDPDVALDDGATIQPSARSRLRKLNSRDPSLLPSSAARVRVLGRGFIEEEIARGSMRSPVSNGSTPSEEAGMLPEVRAASEMISRMTDGPELRRIPVQRIQTLEPQGELWDGKVVQITVRLSNGESGTQPPANCRLTWSSPESTKRSETTWAGSGSIQPTYVLTNQSTRDAADLDALLAGVLLATGASFIAPLIDKLISFLIAFT